MTQVSAQERTAASIRQRLLDRARARNENYQLLLDTYAVERLIYRLYPRETVFAEKLEAIVKLGLTNSRMKDYFDLLALARENAMDAAQLGAAIAATFARRGTALPNGLPIGLTETFADDSGKQTQWQAFLRKSRLQAPPLPELVAELAAFSHTALTRAASIRGPA